MKSQEAFKSIAERSISFAQKCTKNVQSEMISSALLSLSDAENLFKTKNYHFSAKRALDSASYIVGVFNSTYEELKKALKKVEEENQW